LATYAGLSATREGIVEQREPSLKGDPEESPTLCEGYRDEVRALIDYGLIVARHTDIGFRLLDHICGTPITLHADDFKLASLHGHQSDYTASLAKLWHPSPARAGLPAKGAHGRRDRTQAAQRGHSVADSERATAAESDARSRPSPVPSDGRFHAQSTKMAPANGSSR
jgi:hypothetical protein